MPKTPRLLSRGPPIYDRSRKLSRPMAACSLPDILKSMADTFKHFGLTAALSYPLASEGYAFIRLAKVLLFERQAFPRLISAHRGAVMRAEGRS